MICRFCLVAMAVFLAACSRAENWPQFRGPSGDGRSAEKNLPVAWSNSEGIAWKQSIPGEGHSSPIVWGDSIFVTTALPDGSRLLLRLSATDGKIEWQVPVAQAPRESMHRENSSASSTPATDGERVVTSFQSGNRVDLRCYDFSGKELWAVQPLKFEGEHGYSYSPIIYQNLVILDCRQESEAATLALDKKTGKVVWRNAPGRNRISHITPLIIDDGARVQLIVSGSGETRGYDPLTGREFWRCKGPSDVAVAGLAYGEGLVFATAGYPARTRMAIKTTGNGDVTTTGVAWKLPRQVTYVPSPVYHEGHLYTVVDDGLLYCFDARTGETKWEERLGGRHRSSLIFADGKIYATDDKGKTTIFLATPAAFQKLAENDLAEFCYATPAISEGRIFLRTARQLYCIQSRALDLE
jgi:outer membrane protein assembly factor BamB